MTEVDALVDRENLCRENDRHPPEGSPNVGDYGENSVVMVYFPWK